MATGKGLFIGVNHVDADQYRGWDGKLSFCESDAQAIAAIAASKGFDNKILLTADATSEAVTTAIQEAADTLVSGDMFTLFYSGHGNSIKDKSGDEWKDMKDETWCLYDRQLLDDELYALWPNFADGVRILVLSDSCHSGSMTMGAGEDEMVVKAMPTKAAKNIVLRDPGYYSKLRQKIPKGRPRIGATVRLISGCKDYQQSFENKPKLHGQFTLSMLSAWGDGFDGNYAEFYEAINATMPEYQNPNVLVIGADNQKFSAESPFTI